MCGRIGDKGHPDHFRERWAYERPSGAEIGRQIAPTSGIAVIDGSGATIARWGLLPSWTGVLADAKKRSMINARVETFVSNAMFQSAAHDRVVIPVTHWFEWRGTEKIPHLIRRHDQDYLGLAGIREVWRNHDTGELIPTVAILTRPALGWMTKLHHRMPVLIEDRGMATWLDRGGMTSVDAAINSLRDPDVALLTAFPVGRAVNRAGDDQEDLLDAVGPALA